MSADERIAIGTWPTPERPVLVPFEKRDAELMRDLNAVFERHGIKGRVIRVEFGCGMPPQHPKPEGRCFRWCIPGPDDRPICTWICW